MATIDPKTLHDPHPLTLSLSRVFLTRAFPTRFFYFDTSFPLGASTTTTLPVRKKNGENIQTRKEVLAQQINETRSFS